MNKFQSLMLCGVAAAMFLPGCSGVEDEPVGVPTPEAEYELSEEELNAERSR